MRTLFCCVLCVLCASCNRFARIKRSGDWEEKYGAAVAYYEDQAYAKAGLLFEDILHLMKGTEAGEEGLFCYADALYQQKQYVLSAHYFDEFYTTYAQSPHAYEALYKEAHALYASSDAYNLTSQGIHGALAALQELLDTYPEAPDKREVERLLSELRDRLSKKSFEQAKLYYLMRHFKAAIVTFGNFREDFPSFDERVRASRYFSILSQYQLARRSVPEKQEGRYRELLRMHEGFVDAYGGSREAALLGSVYTKALEALRQGTGDSMGSE